MLAPPTACASTGLRILYYCHDSYGLGHLRRTLTLAHSVRERMADATQLVVSGAAHSDGWSLPAGADWVKLPTVVKVGSGEYRPRSLECSFDTARELRKDLILATTRRFRPDVVVVDHVPAGLDGEALPALRHAASTGAQLVLGLRDVLDDATLVQREWRKAGVHSLLDSLYDRIVVYGDPRVYDVVAEYDFTPAAAAKTRHVGYLRAPRPAPAGAVRQELGVGDDRLVVVTAGGGGDGFSLLSTVLQSLAADPPPRTRAFVVTGPLMQEVEQAELARLAGCCGKRVSVVTSVPDLADIIAAADAVISMGGYNTVRELLTYQRPTLLVPRVQPRLEQLLRAEALAGRGVVRLLHPAALTPHRLSSELRSLLNTPAMPPCDICLDGLEGFVAVLEELVAVSEFQESVAHA